MDNADKKFNYVHDYTNLGMIPSLSYAIPEVLGDPDASKEWRNTSEADAQFISTLSYDEFVKPSCLFLVGRIGTGKTAMLYKLKHAIESGANHNYQSSIMLDTKECITDLSTAIRLSQFSTLTYSEIESLMSKKWRIAINTIVMTELYKEYKSIDTDKTKKIQRYLQQSDVIENRSTATHILNLMKKEFANGTDSITQTVSALAGFLSLVTSTEYNEALDEMHALLSNRGKVLILIDSVDRYEYNDTITLAIINALINVCLESDRTDGKIAFKLALPSEVIPKLSSINIEKISCKIVYIHWSCTDLKTLISIRLYKSLNHVSGPVDKDLALDFFTCNYEEYCKTIYGFYFPTFPYCLAFTQKKPRQLISIFNTWLVLEGLDHHDNRTALINDALLINASDRVSGALNIYASVHPDMFEMFKRTFAGNKYCFSEAEFDQYLKNCANIRGDIDAYSLKRYFVSSGLVGIMQELHMILPGNSTFKNTNVIRIKEVLFEYQFKELLPFNSRTKFCLHPMCFGMLNIQIDLNTLVYPKPLEQDGEYIPWASSYQST